MTRIAVVDPDIRPGFLDALGAAAPPGWSVSTDPTNADILITERADVGTEVASLAGERLRLIATLDPGRPRVDVNVPVYAVPNTALTGVAEHAVALILACARQLIDVTERTRSMAYLPDRSTPLLTTQTIYTFNWIGLEDFGVLFGRTVGLVGLGYVGQAVAARLRPFGVRLLYAQRQRLDADVEQALGAEYRTLDELLAASDIVSLHHRFQDGPDGNDQHIGVAELARMKSGSILVNTARGRLIDEDALVQALSSGHLKAAALDVFRFEPLPSGHPFFAIPPTRLLLTPHVAGAPNDQAWRLMCELLIERSMELGIGTSK